MSNQKALYDLLVHANHLKQLPRTGWLYAGVVQPESVAEHSYVTALLVLHLGSAINQSWQDEALDGPIDLGKATQMALLHDLAESLLTDLPKRSAELLGTDLKHKAEESAMHEILGSLPNQDQFLTLTQDYAQKSTPEARLVKDADRLEMIFQAHMYEQRGQANLAEFWEGHQWYYRTSEALFHEINAHR